MEEPEKQCRDCVFWTMIGCQHPDFTVRNNNAVKMPHESCDWGAWERGPLEETIIDAGTWKFMGWVALVATLVLAALFLWGCGGHQFARGDDPVYLERRAYREKPYVHDRISGKKTLMYRDGRRVVIRPRVPFENERDTRWRVE